MRLTYFLLLWQIQGMKSLKSAATIVGTTITLDIAQAENVHAVEQQINHAMVSKWLRFDTVFQIAQIFNSSTLIIAQRWVVDFWGV